MSPLSLKNPWPSSLDWPARLSPESQEELLLWLHLIKRKIKREAPPEPGQGGQ